MALKITKSTDAIQIERLNVCIYGPPGLGKSTLAFTAARPLLLDFDQGSHRAANRKDTVRVNSWADVADISASDLEPYETVVIDTAGRALDSLSSDIIRANPKLGRGGALTLQGYGELKSRFVSFLKMVNGFGKDVILIAHSDEQRNGDELIERLDVQGGSKGEIYKAADAMGRISIRDGKRWLNFSPTDAAFGKNPGQLAPLEIPHPDKAPEFMGEVMQSIKDKLNVLTEAQRIAQTELEEWRQRVSEFSSADDFNEALEDFKKQSKTGQALFIAATKAVGLKADKSIGKYVQGDA